MEEKKLYNELLEKFKPILVIYIPFETDKETRTKTYNVFNKRYGDKYEILMIPYNKEHIDIKLLSVLKEEFIKDKDLKRYIDKITKENFKNIDDLLNKAKENIINNS